MRRENLRPCGATGGRRSNALIRTKHRGKAHFPHTGSDRGLKQLDPKQVQDVPDVGEGRCKGSRTPGAFALHRSKTQLRQRSRKSKGEQAKLSPLAVAPVTMGTGRSWQFAWWTRSITAPTARGVSKSSARALSTLDLASANLVGKGPPATPVSHAREPRDSAGSGRERRRGATSPRGRPPGWLRTGADPSRRPERRA